jgi:hypothetical protein
VNTIYFDAPYSDAERRQRLYNGQLFVFSPCPSALALATFAREMAEEAFAPLDPREAQYTLPVEEYAAILAKLKPPFINHPQSKHYVQGILRELGCDLDKTYFDVPRLRTMTHGGYLTAGLAYAFHPHRDTWYSAPFCQINWWLPVYDIDSDSALAFHPRYWSQPVKNGSSDYNYYIWNQTGRRTAAQQITTDTRPQPRPEEPIDLEPQVRVVAQVGGLLLFSGAQLHSTVPNTSGRTRYSIDFRTIHFDDVVANRGAPNIDSACTGTMLRDYLRGSDFSRMPEEIALLYDAVPPTAGDLIYQPPDFHHIAR